MKSLAYLTNSGFKKDFLAEAWAQWVGGAPFDPERDYLVLAVDHLADTVSIAWEDIERRAISGAPEHLFAQLTRKGSSSALERAIFKSITDAQPKSSSYEGARLLKHLRVRHFGVTVDAAGINECFSLLKVEDRSTAEDLWKELQQLASDLRTTGGVISLESLLQRLRNRYQLKAHPNYRGAWQEAERSGRGLWELLGSVCILTCNLLQNNVLIRGAMTAGGALHNKQFVYGTAVNRAVVMEKAEAVAPLTLLSPEFYEDAKAFGPAFLGWLEEDAPGRFFVHYLRSYAEYHDTPALPGKVLDEDAGQVVDFVSLRLHQDEEGVLQKAQWFQSYWNRTAAKPGRFPAHPSWSCASMSHGRRKYYRASTRCAE